MSERGNTLTPAELAELGRCPAARDGGAGPRRCVEIQCRLHLLAPAERGPCSRRFRLVVLQEDSCAGDVERRGPHRGVELTQQDVGVLLGISRQAVSQLERSAIAKLRRAPAARELRRR